MTTLIWLVALSGVAAMSVPSGLGARTALTDTRRSACPEASQLERPDYLRGAIPAAKEALGSRGRVIEIGRGPDSTYATTARRSCGVDVLRDSVYVVVHPVGMTCAACDLHAYVVKFRRGGWEVWAGY